MNFDNLSIVSVRHVDAPHSITSAAIQSELEETMERLGMPPNLLESVAGIRERRYWDEGVQPSDAATLAAEAVLADSGLDRSCLGIIVNTSVCRDYVEPSTACLVHGNLGLPATCMNMDVGNACLAFLNGMEVVGNMIERGQIDYGMIVDAESSRFLVESTIERLRRPETDLATFRDEFASLTTGSGAVAMILARADLVPDGHRFRGTFSLAATEHNRLCVGQVERGITDTKGLMVEGVELSRKTWAGARQHLGFEASDVDQYCLHQVSQRHAEQLAESLELDVAKTLLIVDLFGNIGPASVPIVLSKALDLGRIQKGNRIVLAGIGSGLNCTVGEIIW
ncbi:MAG: 3-oxoacyl-ACP synthase III [Candidatus Binatia bacterium]|nr:3-oxoacyl-ACP synthase III [Candidatus Binatia bacterium]MDG1960043.1 3-oxoacyl-ACP synthase III [Candidatus Binatia bacterium]MDG2009829.1 3-oxoacyl-ACP synthase III [Candidatus Binatia bacterium]